MVKKVVTEADILRAARRRIDAYQNSMLCMALDGVRIGTVEQKTALKRWISKLLDGSPTYCRWLCRTDPKRYGEMLEQRGSFRKARLAWLDWMIAEKEKTNG